MKRTMVLEVGMAHLNREHSEGSLQSPAAPGKGRVGVGRAHGDPREAVLPLDLASPLVRQRPEKTAGKHSRMQFLSIILSTRIGTDKTATAERGKAQNTFLASTEY